MQIRSVERRSLPVLGTGWGNAGVPSLLEQLRTLVGPNGLATGEDIPFRKPPWSGPEPGNVLAFVRPASTSELSLVLAACHAAAQPVVVQGGLTGLVDGATPLDGELVVSLERMNRVESIDPAGRVMTAQAGTPVQLVQERAAQEGLLFPVDWGARGTATVGGAIATNAGGNAVLRYGMMREQVLGLEAVLADGTVISSMNNLIKNNTGYDLKQLFIGSEGTLGIVTRAVLRLRPAPSSRCTALMGLTDLSRVVELLTYLDSGLAGTLSAYEVMWQDHYRFLTGPGGYAPILPACHAYFVLAEATGSDARQDAERFEALLSASLENGLIADAIIATSDTQREAMWSIREDVEPVVRGLAPLMAFDVSVPIRHAEEYLDRMTRDVLSRWPQARRIVMGHLGDNNLHIGWSVGDGSPEAHSMVSRVVYDNLRPYGGSISAEHGIGLLKRNWLDRSRSGSEIALMQSIKRLLDPRGILSPGRLLPPQATAR